MRCMEEDDQHSSVSKFQIGVVIVAILAVAVGGLFVVDLSGDGLEVGYDLYHGTDPMSQDTSGNGLTDYEEIRVYGTNPLAFDTTGDGLSDYDEIHLYGTDPTTTDTTGDGLVDYDEIYEYGTDPTTTDTNGDGLSDAEQILEYGTDPLKNDTLGNGLSDYDEIHVYGTDPLKNDTTGDGLSDYDEVNVYGTDPTVEDTTGDGLTDYREVVIYDTDPTKVDTLGNGLSDYDEIRVYGTDPLKNDTSGNGISDYDEIHVYGTDPTEVDTTMDGMEDATYINYNQNPLGDNLLTENYENITEHPSFTTEPIFEQYSSHDNTGVDSTGDGFSDSFAEEVDVLDPDKQNIVIYVEHMEGVDVDISALIAVRETFENSPGEDMNVVFRINPDPVPYQQRIDFRDYERNYFPNDVSGKHHVLFADDTTLEDNSVAGFAGVNIPGMAIGDSFYTYEAITLAHEVGHSVGLYPSVFGGIDTRRYSVSEYNSVMNYNVMEQCVNDIMYCSRYSTGGEFNDWEYIQNNLSDHNPQID